MLDTAVSYTHLKCTTILTNLLINALKYTPDESTISISTRLSEAVSYTHLDVYKRQIL